MLAVSRPRRVERPNDRDGEEKWQEEPVPDFVKVEFGAGFAQNNESDEVKNYKPEER